MGGQAIDDALPMFKIPLDVNGVLATTPRPRGGDWLEDDVRRWGLHGVGIIVSLPVPDLGVPADAAGFIERVHALAGRLCDGASIAVHCRQSVGRSGLLSVSIAIA